MFTTIDDAWNNDPVVNTTKRIANMNRQETEDKLFDVELSTIKRDSTTSFFDHQTSSEIPTKTWRDAVERMVRIEVDKKINELNKKKKFNRFEKQEKYMKYAILLLIVIVIILFAVIIFKK